MSERAALAAVMQLLALLEGVRTRRRGLLGAGDGSVEVSDKPNTVWFREDGNPSRLRQIKNFKMPNIHDLPVVTGEDANNPGEEQVLDIDMTLLPNWFGRTYLPGHHATHEIGGTDSAGNRIDTDIVWVQKQQMLPMLLTPQSPADMTMHVNADYYLYGDDRNYWPGGDTKTFSAPVTDGFAVYELVCVNGATNTLTYVTGTQFAIAAPREEGQIPEIPAGCVPVGAVYLPHGATSLTFENLADVRILWRTLGGTVTHSAHRHTSEFDGGILCSGLTVTGDQLWKRSSDTSVRGSFESQEGRLNLYGGLTVTGDIYLQRESDHDTVVEIRAEQAEVRIRGTTTVTGDVVVSGGMTTAYDAYVDMAGQSRLRIPRGVDVTGWAALEGEIAFDTGHKLFFGYEGTSWVSLDA